MPKMFNKYQLQLMHGIKNIFNKSNLSNPGKIFPIKGGCGEINKNNKKVYFE